MEENSTPALDNHTRDLDKPAEMSAEAEVDSVLQEALPSAKMDSVSENPQNGEKVSEAKTIEQNDIKPTVDNGISQQSNDYTSKASTTSISRDPPSSNDPEQSNDVNEAAEGQSEAEASKTFQPSEQSVKSVLVTESASTTVAEPLAATEPPRVAELSTDNEPGTVAESPAEIDPPKSNEPSESPRDGKSSKSDESSCNKIDTTCKSSKVDPETDSKPESIPEDMEARRDEVGQGDHAKEVSITDNTAVSADAIAGPTPAETQAPLEGVTESSPSDEPKESGLSEDVEAKAVTKRKGRPRKSNQSTPAKRPRQSYVPRVSDDGDNDKMEAEDTADSGDDDKPVLGSLEGPVPIQTGKRNRRKVDRLSENITAALAVPPEKKKFTIPEGSGVKLGDITPIEEVISKTKADELKIFHRILYGTPGKTSTEIKKNIRAFCGWTFTKDDGDYKRKHLSISKINLPVLKSWCTMLQLPVSGSKESIVDRLLDFLLLPAAKSAPAKEKKTDAGNRKRAQAKAAKKSKDEDDSEDVEDSADEQDDNMVEKSAVKKRRTTTKAPADSTTRSPTRKSRTPAKGKDEKTGAKGRGRGRNKSKQFIEEEEEEENPDAPPTDDIITKKIKEILKTANLELVTMKIVRQQLIDMYPNHDLSSKREFIKSTVKEILGA